MPAERRVIFLSTEKAVWGAEYSLLQIAKGLRGLGVEVEVWAESDELLADWGPGGRNVQLGMRAHTKNRRLLRLLPNVPTGSTLVSFDVSLAPALALARPYLRARGIRVALDFHVVLGKQPRQRLIAHSTRWADVSVCVSDFIAAQLPDGTRTEVVWRPMPPPDIQRDTNGRFVVGIVGRIDAVKRVDLALQACAMAESEPAVVLRGGTFLDGDDYLAEILALGDDLLGPRFRYEGRVPQPAAMRGIDVLLHTNEIEPSGRVVAEAQFSGVVPIVPDIGGAPEFIEHGVTGLAFSANDPLSAAVCIDALADSGIRRRIAATGRQFAEKHYDLVGQSAAYGRALGVLS